MFELGIAPCLWRIAVRSRLVFGALLMMIFGGRKYQETCFHLPSLFVGRSIACFEFITKDRKALPRERSLTSLKSHIDAFPVLILFGRLLEFASFSALRAAKWTILEPFTFLSDQFIENRKPIWNRSGSCIS
jgi:hypothetical protein